jgi:hypothetical protein
VTKPLSTPSHNQPPDSLQHIPFRDSTLTRLLKHSLGGNCYTLMIACVCPTDVSVDENVSTLKYGAWARKMQNQAMINEHPNVKLIRQLRAEVSGVVWCGVVCGVWFVFVLCFYGFI